MLKSLPRFLIGLVVWNAQSSQTSLNFHYYLLGYFKSELWAFVSTSLCLCDGRPSWVYAFWQYTVFTYFLMSSWAILPAGELFLIFCLPRGFPGACNVSFQLNALPWKWTTSDSISNTWAQVAFSYRVRCLFEALQLWELVCTVSLTQSFFSFPSSVTPAKTTHINTVCEANTIILCVNGPFIYPFTAGRLWVVQIDFKVVTSRAALVTQPSPWCTVNMLWWVSWGQYWARLSSDSALI